MESALETVFAQSHFFKADPTFALFVPKLTRLWWRQQCSLQSPGLLFLQIQAVSLSLQKYWWPLTGVAPSNFSSTDDTRLSVVHRVVFPPWHSSIQSSCWVEPRYTTITNPVGTQESFIRKGSAARCNPLPFHIPSLELCIRFNR